MSEQIYKERIWGNFPLQKVAAMILEHNTWKTISRTETNVLEKESSQCLLVEYPDIVKADL